MLEFGLESEVRGLIERHGPLIGTAGQAVGYKELQAFILENKPFEQTVEEIKAHTRQFARRQEIWFRSLSELKRFELTPETETEQMVDDLVQFFTGS